MSAHAAVVSCLQLCAPWAFFASCSERTPPPTSSSCSPRSTSEVDDLIAKLEHGSGPRRGLLIQLADKPRGARDRRGEAVLPGRDGEATPRTSCTRRSRSTSSIKRLLADMIAMRLDDDIVRGEALRAQGAGQPPRARGRGEATCFPRSKAMLSADERAALGNEVLVMFEELMQGHPSQHVPRRPPRPRSCRRYASRRFRRYASRRFCTM